MICRPLLWRIFRIFGRPFEAVRADDGVSRRDECTSTGRERPGSSPRGPGVILVHEEHILGCLTRSGRPEIGRNRFERTLQNTENSPEFFLIRLPSPPAPETVPRWPGPLSMMGYHILIRCWGYCEIHLDGHLDDRLDNFPSESGGDMCQARFLAFLQHVARPVPT